MSYTKGPWFLMETGFGKDKTPTVYNPGADLEMIAYVPRDRLMQHSKQDNISNARLITAAPQLLEALQSLVTRLRAGDEPDYDDLTEYQEIIDKALNVNNN